MMRVQKKNVRQCISLVKSGLRPTLVFACVFFTVLPSQFVLAAADANVRMPRLENLEKLTVGPDNHYQVAIGRDEDKMFFTRSSNLATRLYWRGLKGFQSLGQVQPFLNAEFDSKDPAISADGARIAFTSFERRARGDICVQDVNPGPLVGLLCAEEKTAAEQPFWLGAGVLGFIRRPLMKGKSQLVRWDLQTNQKSVLLEDNVFSVHADPQGRWVVYASMADKNENTADDLDRVLKVFRFRDTRTWSLRIALPGLSGFPRFDERGEFLYFAQFSNDTNADARIDGNDNGVIFRLSTTNLEDSESVLLPEQLTTAEQNCNYPAPGRDSLYMTCAFEGTLDVYRIPKTGLVPPQWSEKTLLDAYRTSRSVAERTLLTNTLRYRYESYRQQESLEKILSQHFLKNEYQAALYYLGFVEANATFAEKQGYFVLRNILEILQYRAREKLDQISPEFVALLNEKRKQLSGVRGEYRTFADLGLIYIDLSSRNFKKATECFERVDVSRQKSPLEQYVYLSLANVLLEQRLLTLENWYSIALNVAQGGVFTDEAKAYVSSLILSKVAETNRSASERLSRVAVLLKKLKTDALVHTILKSQEFILKVANAQSETDEDQAFQDFNKIFSKTTEQYYVNRALSVQAVLTLAEFNKTRVMGFVAANWLSAAKLSDTEYMHARDQYVGVVLDKAYAFWAKPDAKSASQVFYSSVRLTDDQEAHLGFVTTLLQENNRKLLDERYASLRSASFTAANLDFAKAVVLLFDDLARKNKDSIALLNQAEKLLLALKDDGARPAGKHFLLGTISHEKMLRQMKKFTFDTDLSQAAHHQYMIALDLGRRSPRLSAQVLQNLATLHLQTGHFGLALGYYAARDKIAFENEMTQISFLWNYAKALYRNGEFLRAAEVSQRGLDLARKNKLITEATNAWMERSAFHLSQADRFADAAELYGQLLTRIESRQDENTLKALFMHAWTLMKSERLKEASQSFEKTIALSEKLKPRKAAAEPGDVIDFQPQRYLALSYGFLTQMSQAPSARIPLRLKRMEVMKGWSDSLSSFALSQENWARFVLKDCTSQSVDYFLNNEFQKSAHQLDECLKSSVRFAEESDEPAGDSTLETLRVHWMLASRLREKRVENSAQSLDSYLNLSRRALSKLDSLAAASRPMAKRWLQLKAEHTAARCVLMSSDHREFLKKSECSTALQQLSASDRVELLSEKERAFVSAHLGQLLTLVNQIK